MEMLLLPVLLVFGLGFAIGLAVFHGSRVPWIGAFFCGVGAIFVVGAIIFAGCAAMFRGL